MTDKIQIIRYAHGYFMGGVKYVDVLPSVTCSGYENNNFIVEKMGDLRIRNATADGYISVHKGGYSTTNTRTARPDAGAFRTAAIFALPYSTATKFYDMRTI